MSSTPDLRERGQALAIFALSITTVLLAGALAFDAGIMFVEKRDQQNAADAAAIAGARYLVDQSGAAANAAEGAARDIARDNGFLNGDDDIVVDVNIPPRNGVHRGLSGYIEVEISNERPSVFAGIMGVADWDVAARAVARNSSAAGGDFTILALDPNGCETAPAFKVNGSGKVTSHGDIQVNSTCDSGALLTAGTGQLTVLDIDLEGGACNVVGADPGSISETGGSSLSCTKNMGATAIDDPLIDLREPTRPALAPNVENKDSTSTLERPQGCPGATKKPPSWDSPQMCAFKNPKYNDTEWILSPGLYPGGLDLANGTFYLKPGIYYVAGGGINVGGATATAYSADDSGDLDLFDNATGGVMLFNTDHPTVPWKPLQLNSGFASLQLLPLDRPIDHAEKVFNGIVLYNDRDFPTDPSTKAVTLNGSNSDLTLRGTVYAPGGEVWVNGDSDEVDFVLDQVIAWAYTFNGNGGSLLAMADDDYVFHLNAAGLIE